MISKRDEDPTRFCIPLRDKPLPIYSTFPIADFSTHLGYPTPALRDALKVRGERDDYTQVSHEPKVSEGRRRSRVSDEGNVSPISDSFSYMTTTDSIITSSPPRSSSRSSFTTVDSAEFVDEELELKIERILQAKHLEKQWFTNGQNPPLAPGYNH